MPRHVETEGFMEPIDLNPLVRNGGWMHGDWERLTSAFPAVRGRIFVSLPITKLHNFAYPKYLFLRIFNARPARGAPY
ncbi:hypothetical protein BH11PSE5_BH11PSE5_22030 [soil metagenome]